MTLTPEREAEKIAKDLRRMRLPDAYNDVLLRKAADALDAQRAEIDRLRGTLDSLERAIRDALPVLDEWATEFLGLQPIAASLRAALDEETQ